MNLAQVAYYDCIRDGFAFTFLFTYMVYIIRNTRKDTRAILTRSFPFNICLLTKPQSHEEYLDLSLLG